MVKVLRKYEGQFSWAEAGTFEEFGMKFSNKMFKTIENLVKALKDAGVDDGKKLQKFAENNFSGGKIITSFRPFNKKVVTIAILNTCNVYDSKIEIEF